MNYRAAQAIQKDMWKSYTDFVNCKKKQLNGTQQVREHLKKCTERPEQLNQNRRSHPDIVIKCSNAFYNSEMKPCKENGEFVWTEPEDFPLRPLQNRVIFIHLDSAEQQQRTSKGAWRNDAELLVTQQLKMALMGLGIPSKDIMCLAAYTLQAHRIGGRTVPAAQGTEGRVVIYTMASYARATDATGRQSLRGDTLNTAVTRAQSIAFIVCDTNAVKRNTNSKDGTWQLLNSCPVIPADVLLRMLEMPCDVAYLNAILSERYSSDKKKRGHPTTQERKQNKRANVRNL